MARRRQEVLPDRRCPLYRTREPSTCSDTPFVPSDASVSKIASDPREVPGSSPPPSPGRHARAGWRAPGSRSSATKRHARLTHWLGATKLRILFRAVSGSARYPASRNRAVRVFWCLPTARSHRRRDSRRCRFPNTQQANANNQSARPSRPKGRGGEVESPSAQEQSVQAWRVHPRLHHDAQEAKLGTPKGCARTAHQSTRSHGLHPGRRAQPAGALHRARAWWPREGFAGRALSHCARDARRVRRQRSQPEPLKVRHQATQEGCTGAKGAAAAKGGKKK